MLNPHFKQCVSRISPIKHWDLEEHSIEYSTWSSPQNQPSQEEGDLLLCSLSFNRGSQAVTPLCFIAKSHVIINFRAEFCLSHWSPRHPLICTKSYLSASQSYICVMSDVSHNLAIVTQPRVTAALDSWMPIWICSCCELTHSPW